MPSERRKKLVDTWGEDELKNSMKETRKERSKEPRSKQDGERDDHDRRKRRDEKGGSRGKDRHETTRDNDRREHSGKERDIKDRRKPKDDDDEERRRRNERRKKEERTKSGKHSDDRKKKEDKERSKHADNEDEVGTSDRKKERRHRDETEEERRKRKEKEREKRHRDREAVENGSSDKDKRRSERRDKNHEEGSSRDREERKRDERKRKDEQEKHENTDEKHRRRKENEDDREPSKNKEDKEKNKDRRRYERKEKDIGENGSRERDERKRDEKHRRREHEEDKDFKKNKEEREHSDTSRKRKEDDIKVEKETEKKTENSKATNNHVDKDNYEDDDFEDYDDDDFEDEDNDDSEKTTATSSEYDDLRRAIAEENEASLRRSLEPSVSSSPSSRPTTSRSSGRTFVNFVAAKQRQISDKVSQKTRKRGQELMALLDLDAVGFDVLDMAPVNEYDLYIRSFGQSNTKQAYAQCNEDNLEREIQTDDIEVETKWTQHPANDSKGCGGETLNEDERSIFKGEDSMRLAHFLEKASRVVCTLLEEEEAANHLSSLQSSNFCFSQGFTHLNMQHPFLEGRDVLQVQFHPVQTSLLLTAHTLPRLEEDNKLKKSNLKYNLNGSGLICLWNLNIPNKPKRVLSCQSSITCCCFSPTKTSSVFAGTVDGSVVAWDLREPSTMHSTFPLSTGASIVDIQPPTYSTDGISNEDNHHSTVVSIQPVVSITDSVQSTKDEGVAFQLASMEQRGQVVFWVVIEVDKVDIAGSQSDLGLVPGGKIKLMKSSSICLKDPRRDVSHLSVRHLHFSQTDANHFYVATDAGYIMHCTRNGTADMPRLYHTQIDFPVDILAVDFHPFGLPFFLVGCRDGCIRLHHTKSEFPVVTWSNSTNGMDLVSLAWSRSRPAVFFSVDVTAKMFIWDLLKSDSNPIRTEQFNNKRLKCLSLSNDHSATRRARSEREPELAVSNEKGIVEIHRLNEQFSRAEQDELTQCKEFLQALM